MNKVNFAIMLLWISFLLLSSCSQSSLIPDTTAQFHTAVAIVSAATEQANKPSITHSPIATNEPSPPEGLIAYYSAYRVHIRNADGSGHKKVPTEIWASDPDWSPDGKRIAFTSGSNQSGYNIYVMNADGSGVVQLSQGEHNWGFPDWSPDGRKIAFSAGNSLVSGDIMVRNENGSNLITIYDSFPASDPAWSPDGKYIAFTNSQSPRKILRLNVEDGSVAELTNPEWEDSDPAWSPDGKYIAFVRHPIGQGDRYLYIANADGSNARQITDEPALEPTWSPDSKYLAFNNDRGIFLIKIDGTGLVFFDHGSHPSWTNE